MSGPEAIPPPTGEYELKARLPDGAAGLRERLRESGWRRVFRGRMLDRCYDDARGSLTAADRVLRIRRFLPLDPRDGAAPSASGPEGAAPPPRWRGARALVAWKGPASRVEGFKRREELETEVGDPEAAEAVLARLGFDRVVAAIDREVEIWRRGEVTARIEAYPRMDTLVELEGPPPRVEKRIGELGLPREAWTDWSLARFVEAFETRTGLEALLCEEEVP